MAKNPNPLRRIVTGHDAHGRSCVILDGHAPSVYHRPDTDAYFNEFWVIDHMPAGISGTRGRES